MIRLTSTRTQGDHGDKPRSYIEISQAGDLIELQITAADGKRSDCISVNQVALCHAIVALSWDWYGEVKSDAEFQRHHLATCQECNPNLRPVAEGEAGAQ